MAPRCPEPRHRPWFRMRALRARCGFLVGSADGPPRVFEPRPLNLNDCQELVLFEDAIAERLELLIEDLHRFGAGVPAEVAPAETSIRRIMRSTSVDLVSAATCSSTCCHGVETKLRRTIGRSVVSACRHCRFRTTRLARSGGHAGGRGITTANAVAIPPNSNRSPLRSAVIEFHLRGAPCPPRRHSGTATHRNESIQSTVSTNFAQFPQSKAGRGRISRSPIGFPRFVGTLDHQLFTGRIVRSAGVQPRRFWPSSRR